MPLKEKHERMLATLGRLGVSLLEQLNAVYYKPGTLTTTARLIAELHNAGYVSWIPWKRFDAGNSKRVWRLKSRGFRYLTTHGLVDSADLVRPSDNLSTAAAPLQHLIEANNLIVSALELSRDDSSLVIDYIPEIRLKRDPIVVGSGLARIVVSPDAWIRLVKLRSGSPPGEAVLVMELDRGTTPIERIEKKIASYCVIDGSEEYRERFGTDRIQVVWVITRGGERRRTQLLSASWAYLKASNQAHKADLFLVGLMDEETDARGLFFCPTRFLMPGNAEPGSLLPASWRES